MKNLKKSFKQEYGMIVFTFFIYLFIYFLHWSIANPRCDSCRWTVKGFSHTYTCIYSPPNSPPRVRSLGWEDPLEKEMAIHSSTTAWKTPWTEEPGRLQSMGSQTVGHV